MQRPLIHWMEYRTAALFQSVLSLRQLFLMTFPIIRLAQ